MRTRLTMRRSARVTGAALCACLLARPAVAGPPYAADDPEPTDDGHYEIYLFDTGAKNPDGDASAAGIDFNYGAAPDLQLTAVLPVVSEPIDGHTRTAPGNVELAAKFRFLHQDKAGMDLAVFPRVLLPSLSNRIGDRHPALLVPLWFQKDWGAWSTFGGGGYEINHGEGARNNWQYAWALARQFTPRLQLGLEVAHRSADTLDGRASTNLGAGLRYDLDPHVHLLGYAAPGVEHPATTNRYQWYFAVLLTF